ncbi:unnamed protein product [Didymodactylos carnosus]|uniref:Uncharacterized protein n=1 Tax=Didymodactylos carnosus TaxID=1234261 RepID=A0A815JV51_9BILA|nr:unnamed protein product [Didymodactylos carnosus]CAF1384322.1 unnamed protein product [Didymodactylos carnosus]CAF3841488.1 unnamed protein product [Didymodactylos carnosus]CAF4279490.1 unnamed protein product [Didymodactylos carnosus]
MIEGMNKKVEQFIRQLKAVDLVQAVIDYHEMKHLWSLTLDDNNNNNDNVVPSCLSVLNLLGSLDNSQPDWAVFRKLIIKNDEEDEQQQQQEASIKGIKTNIDKLVKQLSDDQKKQNEIEEHVRLSMIIFNPASIITAATAEDSSQTLNSDFMWFQLINEVLLRMEKEPVESAFEDLIEMCRKQYVGNKSELALINEFEETYKSTDAVRAARETFLYRVLNSALPAAVTQLKRAKPLASVSHLSVFGDAEVEILFMLGSVFKILNIRRNDNEKLWVVKLFLTSEEGQNELKPVFQSMKNEIGEETSFLSLGNIFAKMGKFTDAEQYNQRFLNSLSPDDFRVSRCYINRVVIAKQNMDYVTAYLALTKALELEEKKSFFNAPINAAIYMNLGIVLQ